VALAETAELIVALALDDNLSGPLSRVSGNLTRFAGGLSQVRKGAGELAGGLLKVGEVAAVGIVAGIAVAVKSAVTFETAMRQIETQAGASAAEMDNMEAALLRLAPAVGATPKELADGLFHVESAGFRGAKALDVLTLAAEGAKVGHADLESVTNALVGALNSGVSGIKNTTEAMGVLNSIVGAGNMRMQDLADAFGTGILATAKTFGVSIESVGAAIADLTRQGVPATDAATRLRMSIALLGASTPKAAKLLATIGISGTQLADDMRGPEGILGAIKDLRKHLDASGLSLTQQAQLLSHAFGGGRSSGAILALVGDVGKLQAAQDQVNAGITAFPTAWAEANKEVGLQWDKLKAGATAAFITVGQAVLPKLTPAIDKLNNALFTNQSRIGEFAGKVADGVGTIISKIEQIDWTPLQDGLRIAGAIAKKAFDVFTSLPPAVQGALISFAAVNKLSGGLIGKGLGNIAGGGIKLLIQSFGVGRGNNPGTPVYVANVTGGLGGPGGLIGGGSILAGTATLGIGSILGITSSVVLGALLGREIGKAMFFDPTTKPAIAFEKTQFDQLVSANDLSKTELGQKIAALDQGIAQLGGNMSDPFGISQTLTNFFGGDQLQILRDQRDALIAIRDRLGGTTTESPLPGPGRHKHYPKGTSEADVQLSEEKARRASVLAAWLAGETKLPNSAMASGRDLSYQLPDLPHIVEKLRTSNDLLSRWGSKLDRIAEKDLSVAVTVNSTAVISAKQVATSETITGSIRYSGKRLPL
jgi:TP901 family phage tail tape measure protein